MHRAGVLPLGAHHTEKGNHPAAVQPRVAGARRAKLRQRAAGVLRAELRQQAAGVLPAKRPHQEAEDLRAKRRRQERMRPITETLQIKTALGRITASLWHRQGRPI